jgi:hypothetical protein
MWPFTARSVGMIRPNMGVGFFDSRKIAKRKSEHLVLYLRARRTATDPAMPDYARRRAMQQKEYHRHVHLFTRTFYAKGGA